MKCALVAAFLMIGSPLYAGNEPTRAHCSRQLIEDTEGFTVYLASLIEEGLIGVSELERFTHSLQSGNLVNPITLTQKQTVPELHEPYVEFDKYLSRSHSLDVTQILGWSETLLKSKRKTQRSRDETKQETKSLNRKMTFYPIPHGEFMMGEKGQEVKVTLTHDIEMMSTKVTQKMWMDVMGVNPSKFRGDLDLPVESMTWWSAIVYANKLSEKHGLKPAYDLTGIAWKPGTKAEDGSLIPKGRTDEWAEENAFKILRKNTSHIYETEGYRLPTEAEAEYVRKNLGQSQTLFHFGDQKDKLKNYAWYEDNSNKQSHPVAEKLSLMINGNPFYDLHGLLYEWCWDRYQDELEGGVNPQGPKKSDKAVLRGGAFFSTPPYLRSADRFYESPIHGDYYIGLRLVRTLFR